MIQMIHISVKLMANLKHCGGESHATICNDHAITLF